MVIKEDMFYFNCPGTGFYLVLQKFSE